MVRVLRVRVAPVCQRLVCVCVCAHSPPVGSSHATSLLVLREAPARAERAVHGPLSRQTSSPGGAPASTCPHVAPGSRAGGFVGGNFWSPGHSLCHRPAAGGLCALPRSCPGPGGATISSGAPMWWRPCWPCPWKQVPPWAAGLWPQPPPHGEDSSHALASMPLAPALLGPPSWAA